MINGANPGYIVFRPLLLFNTLMGVLYVVAGLVTWKNVSRGKLIAAIILVLNFSVLLIVIYLYFKSNLIATQSLSAITFRSVAWLLIFFGLYKADQQQN